MSAELLRRAAQKLRYNAERASKPPWSLSEDGLVWPDSMGDPVSGSAEVENAYYIEMMHPPVALALADWLSLEADMIGKRTTGANGNSPEGHTFHALAVAQAVMREDQ